MNAYTTKTIFTFLKRETISLPKRFTMQFKKILEKKSRPYKFKVLSEANLPATTILNSNSTITLTNTKTLTTQQQDTYSTKITDHINVPTHLDSLAQFDSESKWAWPNLTQAQLDSFWPNLTLLSPSQNGPGPT